MIYILMGGVFLASWIVRQRFTSVMKRLSRVATSSGLSGAEIAQRMLADNGIHDVQIIQTNGQLTDHSEYRTKKVGQRKKDNLR